MIRKIRKKAKAVLMPPTVVFLSVLGFIFDFFVELPFIIAMKIDGIFQKRRY